MNNSNDHDISQPDWIKSAVSELDDSVKTMNSIDANRLRAARQIAYSEAESRRKQSWTETLGDWINWKNGFAVVCTIALASTVMLNFNMRQKDQKPKAGIEVIPLLTAKEDLEFYESVNFLLWLENKQGKS